MKFNPADNVSENPGHSFVAEGYEVVQSGESYIVKKDIIDTVEELQAAIEVAGSEAIEVGAITVSADATIDLKGKRINGTDDVFVVTNGATLTINDSVGGAEVNAADGGVFVCVWANGGHAVINGGAWNGSVDAAGIGNDTIYTKNGGTVVINGGKFSAKLNAESYGEPQYAILNKHDATGGEITVYGGTFVKFNPADNVSENAGHSFVAEGYEVIENANGEFVVSMIKVIVAPVIVTDPVDVTVIEGGDAAVFTVAAEVKT